MRPRPHKPFYKNLALVVPLALLLLVAVFAVLEVTNTTHLFHKAKTTTYTASQSTKGELSSPTPASRERTSNSTNSAADKGTSTSTEPGDTKGNPTAGIELIAPSGNFVSAHKDVPASATLSSVCNTTTGATCQITFTSGSITKSLPAQVTDRGGATYWNSWTPKSIDLTSGTWHVHAIATLNGQTKNSDDALDLEIQ